MPGSAAERALAISLVSGALVLVAFAAIATVRDLVRGMPSRSGPIGRRILQTIGLFLFGAAILAIPGLIAAIIGAPILAAGAPLAALLPLTFAGLVGLWLAQRSSDYGMEGCTRLIAMLLSAYIAVWGVTALAMTQDFAQPGRQVLSLALLKPFAAALPFALLLALVTRSGSKLRAGAVAWVFVAAWAATCFATVESGLWGAWLPASDWLRFAIAGAIGATPVAALFALGPLQNPKSRSHWQGFAFAVPAVAILGMITGLAWAAARATLAA